MTKFNQNFVNLSHYLAVSFTQWRDICSTWWKLHLYISHLWL